MTDDFMMRDIITADERTGRAPKDRRIEQFITTALSAAMVLMVFSLVVFNIFRGHFS